MSSSNRRLKDIISYVNFWRLIKIESRYVSVLAKDYNSIFNATEPGQLIGYLVSPHKDLRDLANERIKQIQERFNV